MRQIRRIVPAEEFRSMQQISYVRNVNPHSGAQIGWRQELFDFLLLKIVEYPVRFSDCRQIENEPTSKLHT